MTEPYKRTTYPIPPGYRMVSKGDTIKSNDLYWNGTGFITVPHTAEYSGAADPDKHSCIIRPYYENYSPNHCYGCGVLIDPTADLPNLSHSGHQVKFHTDECKTEWWHRQDPVPPKPARRVDVCEGCGAGMQGKINYAANVDRVACTPNCAESLTDEDVPVLELLEKREDMIRPNYYQQGGIEVISIIKAFKLGFNLGNVVKYVLRAGLKSDNRLKDLQKANTYLQFELQNEKERMVNQHDSV